MRLDSLLLYDAPRAPSPRRVRMFMAEKGIEIPTRQVDLAAGEQFSPEFEEINPARTVPVLELEDGTRIWESQAICRYLEARIPKPPLLGRDPVEGAKIEMWTRLVEFEILLGAALFLRNTAPAFSGRAIPGVSGGVEQSSEVAERGRTMASRLTARLGRELATRSFLAGKDFSNADIVLWIALRFSRRLQLELSPALEDWMARIASRPSSAA